MIERLKQFEELREQIAQAQMSLTALMLLFIVTPSNDSQVKQIANIKKTLSDTEEKLLNLEIEILENCPPK